MLVMDKENGMTWRKHPSVRGRSINLVKNVKFLFINSKFLYNSRQIVKFSN